jgi:hypothetical protein
MKRMNSSTTTLDISKYKQYLHFYRLLHDKKRNVNYTFLLTIMLLKFKYFCKYTTGVYVNLLFFSFYKNPLYIGKLCY